MSSAGGRTEKIPRLEADRVVASSIAERDWLWIPLEVVGMGEEAYKSGCRLLDQPRSYRGLWTELPGGG